MARVPPGWWNSQILVKEHCYAARPEETVGKVLNTKEEDLVDQVRSREMKLSVAARQTC